MNLGNHGRKMTLVPRPFALVLVAVSPVLSADPKKPAADIAGKVVGVHDGDTLTLLTTDKTEVKVRLDGIDAPETKQAFGSKAKEALSNLVFDKTVVVHPKGKDKYKRTICRVEVAGKDASLQMVKDGFAWFVEKYSKDAALAKAQDEAKGAKRGLWSDPAPLPPWEFRAKKAGK